MEIHPKSIFTKLLYIILILLFANVLGILAKYYFGHGRIYGLVPLFDFDTEKNIPTLYSSFLLITISILLSYIASIYKKLNSPYISWLGLAIIFLFLSIDEIRSFHELLSEPVRQLLNTSGLFLYGWVIPYGIGLIIFVVVYLKFLISLPKNVMVLFIGSGITYVTGAIGFELLGSLQHSFHGRNNLVYSLLYTCEELFEMLGAAIFIYTLLLHIVSQFKFLAITLKDHR